MTIKSYELCFYSSFNDFDPEKLNLKAAVELHPDLSENDLQNMLDHIVQLQEIRSASLPRYIHISATWLLKVG